MNLDAWIQTVKEADARPARPARRTPDRSRVGLLLLMATGRSRSLIGKALIGAAAGAFIGRAASGTGGMARLASLLRTGPPRP